MPLLLMWLVLFLFGLIVGSFLNVVIKRTVRGEALTGRSHCDTCGTILSWRELIPLFSFFSQKGRCRHCGTVLSVQYPLVEFATGLIFAIAVGNAFFQGFITGHWSFLLPIGMTLTTAAAMLVILVADFNDHIIPNGSVLTLLLLGIIAALVRNGLICAPRIFSCAPFSLSGVLFDCLAAAGAMIFLFALWYFSKGQAMGFGDVKLIGATSLLLGFPFSVIAFVLSFWLGGIAGLLLLVLRMRDLKSQIAFGPFIIAGTALAYTWGNAFFAASGFGHFL